MSDARAGGWTAEEVVIAHDPCYGLRAVIVIDDTTLGPALGGVRMRKYACEEDAVSECRLLARAMTMKNAFAATGFGGGKAVIATDADVADRAAVLEAFGRLVARGAGRYIPACDLGTTADDLRTVGAAGVDVFGAAADTGESTAIGVYEAIKATVLELNISDALEGVRVAVQGLGKVGERLAWLLAQDGARLKLSDVDTPRAERIAAETEATVVPPSQIIAESCDVLAPCAMGGVLSPTNVTALTCQAVVAGANNTLSEPRVADRLAELGIIYIPDFVANAGGVIQVRATRDEWPEEKLLDELTLIGDRARELIELSREESRTPLAIAHGVVCQRLLAAGNTASHESHDVRSPSLS